MKIINIKTVAFIATIIILIGTFVFVGCKKEENQIMEQSYKKVTASKENFKYAHQMISNLTDTTKCKHKMTAEPPIVKVLEFHKEGGRRFLGFLGDPRYASVDKTVEFSMLGDRIIKHVYISCIGEGNIKCSEKLANAFAEDNNNGEVVEIDGDKYIYQDELIEFTDDIVAEIDEYTNQNNFEGNIQRYHSFTTISGDFVILHFDITWFNGNENGDADISIVITNPNSNIIVIDKEDINLEINNIIYDNTSSFITLDVPPTMYYLNE